MLKCLRCVSMASGIGCLVLVPVECSDGPVSDSFAIRNQGACSCGGLSLHEIGVFHAGSVLKQVCRIRDLSARGRGLPCCGHSSDVCSITNWRAHSAVRRHSAVHVRAVLQAPCRAVVVDFLDAYQTYTKCCQIQTYLHTRLFPPVCRHVLQQAAVHLYLCVR